MTDQPRFADNGDGTVSDHKQKVMWKKLDSFQDQKKWLNFFKAHDYMEIMNVMKFAGRDDWRFPNEEEAWSLFELDKTNQDKYGDDIYLDPVFEKGAGGTTWTSDVKDSSALVVQFEDGEKVWPSQYANMNMAVRLTRDLE